jgi:hypothetical protein
MVVLLRNRSPTLPRPSSASLAAGLSLLAQAHGYAQDLSCSPWDFAIEVQALYRAGLTNSDLRWLAHRGLVKHAQERPRGHGKERSFLRTGPLRLTERSCFVLTDAGAALAGTDNSGRAEGAGVPHWDASLRELRLDGALVKTFTRPAPKQEIILAAFEEEGWPPRIDDPLPPEDDRDPVRCLHDTIVRLNRGLCRPLHFRGDGSGRGVRWERRQSRARK